MKLFLTAVAELVKIQSVLSTVRIEWSPSTSRGPQFGDLPRHKSVTEAFANIAAGLLDARKARDQESKERVQEYMRNDGWKKHLSRALAYADVRKQLLATTEHDDKELWVHDHKPEEVGKGKTDNYLRNGIHWGYHIGVAHCLNKDASDPGGTNSTYAIFVDDSNKDLEHYTKNSRFSKIKLKDIKDSVIKNLSTSSENEFESAKKWNPELENLESGALAQEVSRQATAEAEAIKSTEDGVEDE